MSEPSPPPDPWLSFESAGEILGFLAKYDRQEQEKNIGEKTPCAPSLLRQVLEIHQASDPPPTREFLEDAAGELTAVGLNHAAAIVLEFVEQAPSQIDMCPYPADTANARSWHRSQQWHRRKWPNYTERPVR